MSFLKIGTDPGFSTIAAITKILISFRARPEEVLLTPRECLELCCKSSSPSALYGRGQRWDMLTSSWLASTVRFWLAGSIMVPSGFLVTKFEFQVKDSFLNMTLLCCLKLFESSFGVFDCLVLGSNSTVSHRSVPYQTWPKWKRKTCSVLCSRSPFFSC